MHVVHYNTKYSAIHQAIKHKDGLAVLGVMFKVFKPSSQFSFVRVKSKSSWYFLCVYIHVLKTFLMIFGSITYFFQIDKENNIELNKITSALNQIKLPCEFKKILSIVTLLSPIEYKQNYQHEVPFHDMIIADFSICAGKSWYLDTQRYAWFRSRWFTSGWHDALLPLSGWSNNSSVLWRFESSF